jgi:pyridoxal phosphate enzyme (YggS family)
MSQEAGAGAAAASAAVVSAAPVSGEITAEMKTAAASNKYTEHLFNEVTDQECATVQQNLKVVEDAARAAFAERCAKSAAASATEKACAVHPVRVVAVSKTKPIRMLQAAYAAGARHFGENYVPELLAKSPLMPPDTQWRMIGHLQSNKADQLVKKVPSLACVETVDDAELATMLNKACVKAGRTAPERALAVYIQVNTSGEDTKSGIFPADSPLLVELAKHIRDSCPHLRLAGLMTIGMPDYSSRPENFECLQQCRRRVAGAIGVPEESLELSMGMSGDYVNAIAMGSTNVRVGSTIFGARVYKKDEQHAAPGPAAPAAAAAAGGTEEKK